LRIQSGIQSGRSSEFSREFSWEYSVRLQLGILFSRVAVGLQLGALASEFWGPDLTKLCMLGITSETAFVGGARVALGCPVNFSCDALSIRSKTRSMIKENVLNRSMIKENVLNRSMIKKNV
jgi:hypothetical protein